jgi:hypothetical protein
MKTSRSTTGTTRKREPEPAQSPRAAPLPDEEEPLERRADAPRYHTFTVRFVLDPHEVCQRTEVTYVQQGIGDAWSGYDHHRLGQWIATCLPQPVALLMHDLRAVTEGDKSQQLVAAGEPLRLRLALNLEGEAGAEQSIPYTVTAYAHNLAGGSERIGEARGRAAIGAATAVEIASSIKEPGTYRLGVRVDINAPTHQSGVMSGGLLQVY